MVSQARSYLRRHLWDVTPRDHWQSDAAFRRRRIVAVATIIVGAALLGVSLRIEQGSGWFYAATLGLALVWTLGAFASGPLHLGRVGTEEHSARPVVQPVLVGLGLAGVFVVGALVVREIPVLADQVRNITGYADEGSLLLLLLITMLNGIAEELFFRGALYAAIRRHMVAVTAVAYAITTAATGNVMLTFAALLLGAVVGLERRASGGILAPILTHLAWSVTMLCVLPLVV
ncbi:MAG: CPBP family intramembrane metalloprotease [Nocardioides sp.]|nr:CPBP family intramembrane metalloprotease [Nocardioides sp.]